MVSLVPTDVLISVLKKLFIGLDIQITFSDKNAFFV